MGRAESKCGRAGSEWGRANSKQSQSVVEWGRIKGFRVKQWERVESVQGPVGVRVGRAE